MKQARREKPIKIMAQVPQLATAGGLVSDECKEIGDEEEGGDETDDVDYTEVGDAAEYSEDEHERKGNMMMQRV